MLSHNGDIYWFGWNGIEKQKTPKNITINANKIIDITSHYNYSISIALIVNGIYYVWGKFGEEINEPNETEFKSFNGIFCNNYGMTYKAIDRFIDFKTEIIQNGEYSEDYEEIEKLGQGFYEEVFKAKDD
jgi:hypothetical protein